MTLAKPSAESQFVASLEEFLGVTKKYIQHYYQGCTNAEDVSKVLKALANLNLDIDLDALKAEFDEEGFEEEAQTAITHREYCRWSDNHSVPLENLNSTSSWF